MIDCSQPQFDENDELGRCEIQNKIGNLYKIQKEQNQLGSTDNSSNKTSAQNSSFSKHRP
jgi:hypothetical protein